MSWVWGGRFLKPLNKRAEKFLASLPFDRRLASYDIQGSIAHTRMLAHCGIITQEESENIVRGLEEIAREIEEGQFPFNIKCEDIHLNIEYRLQEKIGELAGKLHTARSRNDQIALDLRLFLREEISRLVELVRSLQEVILEVAEKNLEVIMPGFTHLQPAQPILFSHHLLAYFHMLERDQGRMKDALNRADMLPLGAGALAGTSFPINRHYLARLLSFSRLCENSVDAVSDRDFILEFLSATSIMMMHLSRLGEELVLWSSPAFHFVELDDAFCTGSSIMPQKKNPDVPELIRAKTGRVYGALITLLTIMKALPLSYNRDLQEDKVPLFDTVDNVKDSLMIMTEIIRTMKINPERMRRFTQEGYLNATDLADYLVRKGIPFRQAHELVSRIVHYALEKDKKLEEFSLEEFQKFSSVIGEDVYQVLRIDNCVAARKSYGGTAPEAVRHQISLARKVLRSGDRKKK